MPTKLNRWGNALGMRIPAYIAEQRGLAAGDAMYIKLLDSGDILIRPCPARPSEIPAEYAGLTHAVIPADPPKVDKW